MGRSPGWGQGQGGTCELPAFLGDAGHSWGCWRWWYILRDLGSSEQ